jgi:hypothetical protein
MWIAFFCQAKPWHLTDCKGEEFIGRYMGDGTVAAAGPTQVGMKKNAGARFYVFAEQSVRHERVDF